MDGPGYLRTLREGWRGLVTGLLLGGLLAGVVVLMSQPVYEAQVRFFISTSAAGEGASSAYEGNLFSQQRITSYAELISDQQLVSAVVRDLGLDMTPDQLADELTIAVVPNTVILDVTVSDQSPRRVVAIAGAVQAEFIRMVTALETPPGATASAVTVHVIADPQLPAAPSSPRPVRDITLGVLAGLAVAVITLLLRARVDTRIRDGERAARELGAPSLGVVLQDQELTKTKVLPAASVTPTAESLRQVVTNLSFLDVEDTPRVITVTSSVPHEGRTTVATNLAVQLADEGRRVVLVEADLRRPQVARFLGLSVEAGLTEVLNGQAQPADVLQQVGEGGRLRVLPAGRSAPNPGTLLGSDRMRELLRGLVEDNDIVLVDAPPLLSVADTSRLLPLTDGAVVCARWGVVHAKELAQARRALDRVGARALGVVVTFLPRSAAPRISHSAPVGESDPGTTSTRRGRKRPGRRRSPHHAATSPTREQSPPATAPADSAFGSTTDTPPPTDSSTEDGSERGTPRAEDVRSSSSVTVGNGWEPRQDER